MKTAGRLKYSRLCFERMVKMKYNISITIVVFRNYDAAYKALCSIEKYTDINILKKVFIVDNSDFLPTNIERKQFEEKISQYSDVKYILAKKNLGFGKGHNLVINEINSEFHAIVNPDIELIEDTFSKVFCFMQDKSIGMCIPKLINENGDLQQVYRREITVLDLLIRVIHMPFFIKRYKFHTLQDRDYSKPFQVPFGQGSFLIVRTEIFKELGGFDDNYFLYLEDADLCKRVNELSKLVYFPGTSVVHQWERGSHKKISLCIIHITSILYYFKKWGVKFF